MNMLYQILLRGISGLLLSLLIVACTPAITGCGSWGASVLPPASATTAQTIETRVLTLVNQARNANGLSVLTMNNLISNIARQHSLDMATGKLPLSHDGFDARVNLIKVQVGGSSFAENVASNFGYADPADETVKAWLASAGHTRNILGAYTLTGIGEAEASDGSCYFTQIFVR
jgi:uncharacterized protein YkwD